MLNVLGRVEVLLQTDLKFGLREEKRNWIRRENISWRRRWKDVPSILILYDLK